MEHLDNWLAPFQSPHTRRAYSRVGRAILQSLDESSASPADLEFVLRRLSKPGESPATSRFRAAAAKSLFRYLHDAQVTPTNLAKAVRSPRAQDSTPRSLTPAQVECILVFSRSQPVSRLLGLLLYHGGLRLGEVLSLRWGSYQGGVLTVKGKGGRVRYVTVSQTLREELDKYKDFQAATERVVPLSDSAARRRVKRWGERAGIPEVSPHWLRHAHATHALRAGAPIHVVQRTLGHRSLETTSRYLHVLAEDLPSGGYL